MFQIDNLTAATTIPASTSAGTPGFFTDGNPATGVAATIMPAEYQNMLMMEIINVLAAAGVTPSKSSFTQLTTAIRALNKQSTILTDTGAANIYAAANSPALTALPATGYSQRLSIAHANTGASTYAPDGLTAKPIYGLGLQPLQGGELPVGIAVLMYLVQSGVNGGNGAWIIIEALGGAQQVALATQSQHAVQLDQVSGLISGSVTSLSADTTLTAAQKGLVIIDATASNRTITLPTANAGLGVIDFIVRRLDNTINTLVVTASGTDKIKFHTHLNAAGYSFLVLMGAGDYWHLRSDGAGGWWPVSRYDNTPVGRITPETTTAFNPGGYGAANGPLLTRATWPWLWDLAQASGMLTTEAARSGMEGGWTSGDGATTFRGPDPRGRHHRFLDESAGIDASRAAGSSQADQFPSHGHPFGSTAVVQPGSGTTVLQPGNGVSSNTGVAGAGSETRVKTIAHPGRIKMI